MNNKQISGYQTSRDYELLTELMKKQSVICILDYLGCRDIAKTSYKSSRCGEEFDIGARGIGYMWTESKEVFMRACKSNNVEFLIPNEN